MYNFLNSKLLPKVSTETPCLDNYEVTNLISEDYYQKSRGFLAYSTIKPPVEVTFELICPINIHYITLSTTIGNQKCTAIEIFTKKYSELFISVGYAKFDNNGVIFCNYRHYSVSNQPPNLGKFSLIFFKSNSYKSFTTANFVKVRIVQTSRSVPCLAKVEIWGRPSKLCSPTTLNSINRLMQVTNTNKSLENVTSPQTREVLLPNDWEIPDDFKDSLTYEVMSIPLTLPSGKTIDNSTLEKYLSNEASYGRPASDPFTGLAFTTTRKPLLNTSLKSRIDMFLIQYSAKPETFAIKRTLGKCDPKNIDAIVTGNAKKRKSECDPDTSISVAKSDDEVLHEAIKKTMNSSDFIQFTAVKEVEIPATVPNCSNCASTTNALYILLCDHLYCKDCLLKLTQSLNCCVICDKIFLRSDAKKYHS